MSDEISSATTDQPPAKPVTPAAKARPGGLATVCVLAIVLGAMGLCGALTESFRLLAGDGVWSSMMSSAAPQPQREALPDSPQISTELEHAAGRYFWPKVGLLVFQACAMVLLLVGGLRAFALKPGGRGLLLVACSLAIVLEVGGEWLHISEMRALAQIAEQFLTGELGSLGAPDASPTEMQGVVKLWVAVVLWTIFIVGGVFVAAKLLYYTWAVYYLTRAKTKALFRANPLV